MGRFFKTTQPQNLDFMYKLPEKYMLMAQQKADTEITSGKSALYDLYGKLKLNALSADKEAANKLVKGYEEKINSLTSEINENPLEFRRKMGDILGLSRQIEQDFTTGEASKIQANYDIDMEWAKDYEKEARKGNLKNANWLKRLRAMNQASFQGTQYNKNTGNYNTYSPENLANYVDIAGKFREIAKKMESQKLASDNMDLIKDANGNVIGTRNTGAKVEVKSGDRIRAALLSEFNNNQEIQDFVRQGSNLQVLQGFFDGETGKPVRTYDFNKNKGYVNPNEESALVNIIEGVVSEYRKNDILEKHDKFRKFSKGNGNKTTTVSPTVSRKSGTVNTNILYGLNVNPKNKADAEKILDADVTLKSTLYPKEVGLGGVMQYTTAITKASIPVPEKKAALKRIKDVEEKLNSIDGTTDIETMYSYVDSLRNIGTDYAKKGYITDEILISSANQMEESIIESQNLKTLHNIYGYADKVDGNIGVSNLLKRNGSKKIPKTLIFDRGNYFDNPADTKTAVKFYDEVTKLLSSSDNNLPEKVLVKTYDETTGKTSVTSMDKNKFLKTYKFINPKADGEENASINLGGTQNRYTNLGNNSSSSSFKKNGYGKAGMILSDVPYIGIDGKENHLEYPIEVPLKFGTKDNVSASILLNSADYYSNDFEKLKSKYTDKFDYDKRLEIISSNLSFFKDGLKYQQALKDKDDIEFHLTRDVVYRPSFNSKVSGVIYNKKSEKIIPYGSNTYEAFNEFVKSKRGLEK